MPYLIRVVVDLVAPDNLNGTQANEIRDSLKDYAGAVVGKNVLNKVITETKPSADWHIHDSENCSSCRDLARDGKSTENA